MFSAPHKTCKHNVCAECRYFKCGTLSKHWALKVTYHKHMSIMQWRQLQIRNLYIKVKVKCTLVQALRLCRGCTAHRGNRGIALPFQDHGTRRGWGVSVTPRPLFIPGKTRYPLYRRLGGPQGQSGQVRKNLAATGIRSPDRPAHSQSLYRLRYPAH